MAATDVVVTSATTLTAIFPAATATMPAGSPGTGAGPQAVVVTLKNGESSYPSAKSVFDYVAESASPSPIPDRDERRPLRRFGIGAFAGRGPRLGLHRRHDG